jgi:hypothetical protein
MNWMLIIGAFAVAAFIISVIALRKAQDVWEEWNTKKGDIDY